MKLNKKTLIIIGAAVALLIVVTSVVLVLANNKKPEPTPAVTLTIQTGAFTTPAATAFARLRPTAPTKRLLY